MLLNYFILLIISVLTFELNAICPDSVECDDDSSEEIISTTSIPATISKSVANNESSIIPFTTYIRTIEIRDKNMANRPKTGVKSFIVGGKNAFAKEMPFQAGIVITYNSGVNSFCGGAVITNKHILSAGHCTHE